MDTRSDREAQACGSERQRPIGSDRRVGYAEGGLRGPGRDGGVFVAQELAHVAGLLGSSVNAMYAEAGS